MFISYRRASSRYVTALLRDRLVGRGFDVFLDLESLDNGRFESVILDEIARRAHAVNRDGTRLFVSLQSGSIVVIDVATNQIVGSSPPLPGVAGEHEIGLANDGGRLYLSGRGGFAYATPSIWAIDQRNCCRGLASERRGRSLRSSPLDSSGGSASPR